VQEGDVLFKIDDEAAQLQMASARAAYESAQAGVTAQNGGSRDLQNYQTEEQIRQLRESLDDTDVKINELEDDLGDLRDAGSKLSNAKKQAQEGANMAGTAYYAAQLELTPQIEAKKAELAETQKQLAAVWAQIDAAAVPKFPLQTAAAVQKQMEQQEERVLIPARWRRRQKSFRQKQTGWEQKCRL